MTHHYDLHPLDPISRGSMADTPSLDLQGFCYQGSEIALPALNLACTDSGAWILERNDLETDLVEYRIEVQLNGILELYSNLVANGVELTRMAHAALSNLCTCMHHIHFTDDPNQILALTLQVNFLQDVTLRSLLMTGSELA